MRRRERKRSMTPTAVDTATLERGSTIGERLTEAARRVAQISQETKRLTSRAADAIEDGVHTTRRAIKSVQRRVEKLGDLKDEAAYRVKRQPWLAIGMGVGIGLGCGVAVGWVASR